MSFFNRQGRGLGRALLVATAAVGALGFTSGAGAQTDSAFVPFVVNVDAMIGAGTESMVKDKNLIFLTVKADEEAILRLPLLQTDGVSYFGTRSRTNAPAVISNHGGKITVNLSAQSYKNAEVSLYTVGGKRVLRRNVSAASAANERITRSNIATGIYMLSIKGADGNAVTSRLTHSGGGLDISVAFGGQNVSDDRRLSKKAAAEKWVIAVVPLGGGYGDSTYFLTPVAGMNPKQNITLQKTGVIPVTPPITPPSECQSGATCDGYDVARLFNKTWMAKNLNIETGNSWCYGDDPSNCRKYGRLYDWATAQTVCPSGWRLPKEYDDVVAMYGVTVNGKRVSDKYFKSTSGWNNGGNGTDDRGFAALPGGYRSPDLWNYFDVGDAGYLWMDNGWAWAISYDNNEPGMYQTVSGEEYGNAYSVRCIKQ